MNENVKKLIHIVNRKTCNVMCLMRKRFAFWHSRSYNLLKTIEVYIEVGIKEVGQKSGNESLLK